MPPKKVSAKADRKKAEAERKAKEEAEAAEAAEREQLEREEREAVERDELERRRVEEEARFLAETARINKMLEQQRVVLDDWKTKQWEEKQWFNYTSCRVLPDPSSVRSFNTYLSLCEERCSEGNADIKDTLSKTQDYIKLCSEIKDLMHGDGLPQPSEADIARYTASLPRLHKLVLAQLDSASIQYLQEADKHVDTETYNMRVEASISLGLVYCLWGNVVKNPRLKSFSFQDELKFTMDLPKTLLLADVAIRVIQLPFDLLSPLSPSYSCKRSPPGKSEGEAPAYQEDDGEAPTNQGAEDRDTVTDPEQLTEKEVAVPSDSPHTENKDESPEPQDQVAITGDTEEGSNPGDNIDPCDSSDELEADEVNLRALRPACGPIIFELLQMPPQPKTVNNWTFRKVVPAHLVPYKYPAEVLRPISSVVSEEEAMVAPPAPTRGSSSWPPIIVSMQLPDKFVFREEPQLAQWDGEKWRTSGFKEVNCDLEGKTISFQTFCFNPLALMADRYSNMPYLSWLLLPAGINHTILTLEGAAMKVTVEIKEHQSTLVGPTEVAALGHILNHTMSAQQLIQALSSAGADFFPALDADKYVSVTPKHHIVEMSVYQSMALACCGVAFQWSRWNSEAGRESIVIRAAQASVSPTTQDPDQLDWCTYVGGRRNFRVAVSEDSTELPDDACEGCEVHPSLYSALEHDASSQTKDNINTTSPMHSEAVKHWLTSVKMLTFS